MKKTKTAPAKPSRETIPRRYRGMNSEGTSTNACVRFDRTGQLRDVNAAAAILFDRSPLSIIGKPFSRFIIRHDAEDFLHHLLRCRMRDQKVDTDLHLKSGSGERIPIRLSSV